MNDRHQMRSGVNGSAALGGAGPDTSDRAVPETGFSSASWSARRPRSGKRHVLRSDVANVAVGIQWSLWGAGVDKINGYRTIGHRTAGG